MKKLVALVLALVMVMGMTAWAEGKTAMEQARENFVNKVQTTVNSWEIFLTLHEGSRDLKWDKYTGENCTIFLGAYITANGSYDEKKCNLTYKQVEDILFPVYSEFIPQLKKITLESLSENDVETYIKFCEYYEEVYFTALPLDWEHFAYSCSPYEWGSKEHDAIDDVVMHCENFYFDSVEFSLLKESFEVKTPATTTLDSEDNEFARLEECERLILEFDDMLTKENEAMERVVAAWECYSKKLAVNDSLTEEVENIMGYFKDYLDLWESSNTK